MKKLVVLAAAVLLLILPAHAVSAQSAVVIDGTTGAVLYEKNADEELPMASTTKIMTALVAIEEGGLDRVYTVKKEYTLAEGSSMYLREGEELTILDTLYGLMLMSGNDAALAIAGEYGGQDAFVEKMNARAAQLGLTQTHFDNPNGLDGETHHTTARELAILASEAMRNEVFRQIVSTKTYTAAGRTMSNHNKLLRLYPDAVGIKTGYTKKSGRCLVSAAERNGRRLIAVTLNAPDDWDDHCAMLDAAFAQYEPIELHQAGQEMLRVPVEGGRASAVSLCAAQTTTVWMTAQEQQALTVRYQAPRFVYAPVFTGDTGGRIYYEVNDIPLAEDRLDFDMSIGQLPPKQNWLERLMEKIQSFLGR